MEGDWMTHVHVPHKAGGRGVQNSLISRGAEPRRRRTASWHMCVCVYNIPPAKAVVGVHVLGSGAHFSPGKLNERNVITMTNCHE